MEEIMNAKKNVLQILGRFLLQIYVLSCMLFAVYFNWQYANTHGFVRWIFMGEVVSTAKSLVWPYFILYQRSEQAISAKDIILPVNTPKDSLSESELEELKPVFEAIKSGNVTDETINLLRNVLNANMVRTGSHLSKQSYQDSFGLFGQTIEYKLELGKSAISSWENAQYKTTERFKILKELVYIFISQEQLNEDIEMIKTAAARKTIITDSNGRNFEFAKQTLVSGLEKKKAQWQAFLKVDAVAQEFIKKGSKTDDYSKAEESIRQGVVSGQLGKHQDALLAFKEAIRHDPHNALAHCLLGTAYIHLGHFQEAVEEYKQAIRLKPDFASAHFDLGAAYQRLGRRLEAVEAYKQAILLNPDFGDAYNNLGSAYHALGRHQEAVNALKQGIRLNPDDIYAHYTLGAAYLSLGNREAALNEYKTLQSLDREEAEKLFKIINK
jgi:tetratricopeptide (TPR) repeat protein